MVESEPPKNNFIIISKCNVSNCRKKLKITDMPCRCNLRFCNQHRYAEDHDCTFNYKNDYKIKLTKDNPRVEGMKIQPL